MAKFRESDLTKILQEFEQNSIIELEFERSIDGKIILEDANIKYDSKHGFININSKSGSFQINTTLVYGYDKTKGKIEIDLETLTVKIKSKS